MKTIWNKLLILSAIAVSIWYFSQNRKSSDVCSQYIESSFQGQITKTYLDEKNKLSFTFEISDVKRTFPYKSIKNPRKYVQINDSIVKEKGQSSYLIYKQSNPDSVIRLDFNCDHFSKE